MNKTMSEVEFELLSKAEKAKELGVSIRTLSRMIKEGQLDWTILPESNSRRRWFFKKGANVWNRK